MASLNFNLSAVNKGMVQSPSYTQVSNYGSMRTLLNSAGTAPQGVFRAALINFSLTSHL